MERSEATAAESAKPSERKTHTSFLILKVDDTYYKLTPILPEDGRTTRAWNLEKNSGEKYTVHLDRHGAHCTCPDWIYRKQNSPDACKHILALRELTLLEPIRHVPTHDTRSS